MPHHTSHSPSRILSESMHIIVESPASVIPMADTAGGCRVEPGSNATYSGVTGREKLAARKMLDASSSLGVKLNQYGGTTRAIKRTDQSSLRYPLSVLSGAWRNGG